MIYGPPNVLKIVIPIILQSPNLILGRNPGHPHPKELANLNIEKQRRRLINRNARKAVQS